MGNRRRNRPPGARQAPKPSKPPVDLAKKSPSRWYGGLDVSHKVVGLLSGLLALGVGGLLLAGRSADRDQVSQRAPSTSAAAATHTRSTDAKVLAVEALRPLMTVAQFKARLGEPTIRNVLPAGTVEFIFVDRDYYVQAIAEDESVIFFAVTTRSREFNPQVGTDFHIIQGPNSVRLGKQTFFEARSGPTGAF